jgi:general secretion pathway protein L
VRSTRLIFAPHDPAGAPTYLLLNDAGEPTSRGEQRVQAGPQASDTDVVLVVPGTDVVARWLHLPTRSDAQARAAAAMLLENDTALTDEPLHLALGPLEPDGHRLVAAVAESRMQVWLGLARAHGLTPSRVIADHLLLLAPADDTCICVVRGETLAVRGPRIAFAAERELAERVLGQPAARPLEGEAAERMLASGVADPALDLLQGRFARAGAEPPSRRALLRAAGLAAVLLLTPAVLDAARATRLNIAAERLEQESARRVASVLPKGAALNDPAAQAQAALQRAELAAGGGAAGLAARLFAAVSEIHAVQVEGVMAAADEALRVTISHTNYSDVDRLRAALTPAGVDVREEATREEGDRIVSDLILGARP